MRITRTPRSIPHQASTLVEDTRRRFARSGAESRDVLFTNFGLPRTLDRPKTRAPPKLALRMDNPAVTPGPSTGDVRPPFRKLSMVRKRAPWEVRMNKTTPAGLPRP